MAHTCNTPTIGCIDCWSNGWKAAAEEFKRQVEDFRETTNNQREQLQAFNNFANQIINPKWYTRTELIRFEENLPLMDYNTFYEGYKLALKHQLQRIREEMNKCGINPQISNDSVKDHFKLDSSHWETISKGDYDIAECLMDLHSHVKELYRSIEDLKISSSKEEKLFNKEN